MLELFLWCSLNPFTYLGFALKWKKIHKIILRHRSFRLFCPFFVEFSIKATCVSFPQPIFQREDWGLSPYIFTRMTLLRKDVLVIAAR